MKYSKEITKSIADYIEKGAGRVESCHMADISYETFTVWMKKPEFSEAIKRAESKCKFRNIALIQRAALKTWQAAAWWLERKHPDEFSLRQKQDITLTSPEPIVFVPAKKTHASNRGH